MCEVATLKKKTSLQSRPVVYSVIKMNDLGVMESSVHAVVLVHLVELYVKL